MTVLGFSELTLEVEDLEAAARFYTSAFGLQELSRDRDRIWLAVGERARLGLWSPGAKEHGDRGGAHVHFAFSVTEGSIEELAMRVHRAGGATEGPSEHEGGDRSLYVTDPAGNVVEAWDFFDRDRTLADLRDGSLAGA